MIQRRYFVHHFDIASIFSLQCLQEIKHSLRIIRGVNYSVARQSFYAFIFCQLSSLNYLHITLKGIAEGVQQAVCAVPRKERGNIIKHYII